MIGLIKILKTIFILLFTSNNCFSISILDIAKKPLIGKSTIDKKAVDFGIGFLFKDGQVVYSTPSSLSVFNFDNIKSFGLSGHFTLNITDRIWTRFDGEGSFISNGKMIRDDTPTGFNFLSFKKLNGRESEIKLTAGFDFLRVYKVDRIFFNLSFYSGWFYKNLIYKSTKGINATGYQIDYDGSMTDQIDHIKFNGGVFGLNVSYYYSKDIICNVSGEFYIANFGIKSDIIAMGLQSAMTSNKLTTGGGIKFSIDINTDLYGLWISPFIKYQILNGKINKETRGEESITSNEEQKFTYSSIATGIVLSWK